MKLKFKMLASIMLILSGINVCSAQDEFGKRTALLEKYKNNKPTVISFYLNKKDDSTGSIDEILPLSNILSDKLDKLVVLDYDKNLYNLNKEILNNTELLFAPVMIKAELEKNNWKPIAIFNKKTSPMIIVPKKSNISNVKDLKDKNILVKEGLVNDYSIFALIKSGIYGSKESTNGKYHYFSGSTKILVEQLINPKVDAVIIDEEYVEGIKINDKYKIIPLGSSSISYAVFANNKTSDDEINKYKEKLLNLTTEDKNVYDAFKSIHLTVTDKKLFSDIKDIDLNQYAEVFKVVKIKELLK